MSYKHCYLATVSHKTPYPITFDFINKVKLVSLKLQEIPKGTSAETEIKFLEN